MDTSKIPIIVFSALKEINVIDVSIVESYGDILKLKVVSPDFAKLDIPQRCKMIDRVLNKNNDQQLKSMVLRYNPLTPHEDIEWNGESSSEASRSYTTVLNKEVAKEADI